MTLRTAGIGFDFDHTLGVDNGLERRALYRLAAEAGRPIPEDDRRQRAFVEALLSEFRAGACDTQVMLQRFAADLGVPELDPELWRAHCYALVEALVRPLPGALEALAALRERAIPLAILTNGWSPLQQMKITRALGPQAIATVLVSDQLGVAKPARAAFDALAGLFDGPREAMWYVGDNARVDVGGALAAGLRAIWLDREGQTYPPELPPPTAVIHHLRELEALTQNTFAP